MEGASFKIVEGLEEEGDKGLDVLGCLLGGVDVLAVIGVREADSDALIAGEAD